MSDSRRGMVWKLFHASRRAKIALFFILFAVQIIAFTSIFHYAYPVLEGKPISWPNALLFILETVTTVGYGDLLPGRLNHDLADLALVAIGLVAVQRRVLPVSQLGEVLSRAVPERLPLLRSIYPGQAHPVSHRAHQDREPVPVGHLNDLAQEGHSMNNALPQPEQQYQYFSPWARETECRSCRTCTHSIGWDEHHLFCQAARIVPVFPCGRWERGGGGD